MSFADLRREYTQGGLIEAEVGDDPFAFFRHWFDQALQAKLYEPNAMTLVTCTSEGKPSARIVLLKGFDERGFTFFTNHESRKGHEMAENPFVALVFYWGEIERQVRVEGRVIQVTAAESDAYFQSRPRGSQLGAWASEQSTVIAGREALEQRLKQIEEQVGEGPIPRPPHWGGFRVVPEMIEFWQGRPNRLHDRIRFQKSETAWIQERLSP